MTMTTDYNGLVAKADETVLAFRQYVGTIIVVTPEIADGVALVVGNLSAAITTLIGERDALRAALEAVYRVSLDADMEEEGAIRVIYKIAHSTLHGGR